MTAVKTGSGVVSDDRPSQPVTHKRTRLCYGAHRSTARLGGLTLEADGFHRVATA